MLKDFFLTIFERFILLFLFAACLIWSDFVKSFNSSSLWKMRKSWWLCASLFIGHCGAIMIFQNFVRLSMGPPWKCHLKNDTWITNLSPYTIMSSRPRPTMGLSRRANAKNRYLVRHRLFVKYARFVGWFVLCLNLPTICVNGFISLRLHSMPEPNSDSSPSPLSSPHPWLMIQSFYHTMVI